MHQIHPFRPHILQRSGRRPLILATATALILGLTAAKTEEAPSPSTAPPPATPAAASPLDELIAEASRRFGVPASWIAEVMSVESRGRADALSPKGAIGLMQVTPATYAELASRYGLGSDPWNPHDNVLAGAAYLRELYVRYGAPGFLVAYNAGPVRWEDYLARARPLPVETVAYIARLAPKVGGAVVTMSAGRMRTLPRSPYASPLFVQLNSIAAKSQAIAERERVERLIEANATIVPQPDTLYATHAGGEGGAAKLSVASRTGAHDDAPGNTSSSNASTGQVARNPLFSVTASATPRP